MFTNIIRYIVVENIDRVRCKVSKVDSGDFIYTAYLVYYCQIYMYTIWTTKSEDYIYVTNLKIIKSEDFICTQFENYQVWRLKNPNYSSCMIYICSYFAANTVLCGTTACSVCILYYEDNWSDYSLDTIRISFVNYCPSSSHSPVYPLIMLQCVVRKSALWIDAVLLILH